MAGRVIQVDGGRHHGFVALRKMREKKANLCYPARMRMILVTCLLLLSLALPASAEPVLLVTSSYDPYVIEGNRQKGFLYEVVVAAFAEVGVEAQIQYRPWRRCALMVEEGKAFGAFPYGKTAKRAEYAWFTDRIGECRNVFFYLKGRMGDFDFETLADLIPYFIAGTSGHYYETTFEEARLKVDYAPGEASGIQKIWMFRTELFAEDKLVGWALINRIFPKYKHMFGSTSPWNINPQHIMVSKGYPGAENFMKQFNRGLAEIRANGTYDAILSKYFNN